MLSCTIFRYYHEEWLVNLKWEHIHMGKRSSVSSDSVMSESAWEKARLIHMNSWIYDYKVLRRYQKRNIFSIILEIIMKNWVVLILS